MRRTLYLAALFLFLGSSAIGQAPASGSKEPLDVDAVRKTGAPVPQQGRVQLGSQDASRAACDGDTVFYEDFANGFAGNNGLGIAWDTAGNYQAWRECNSNCTANHGAADPGPLESSTAMNGYVNLDVGAECGCIYAPNEAPSNQYCEAPAPDMKLTMGSAIDLSSVNVPLLQIDTRFYHCCNADHEVLVQVSTDGGSSWTSFNLANNYGVNAFEMPNPEVFSIPLGNAISGNPSNVLIRFYWPDGVDGAGQIAGYYNWYIDDVRILEPNKNDVSLAAQTAYVPDSSAWFNDPNLPTLLGGLPAPLDIEYTHIPRCNFNCMNFGGKICNIGRNSVNDAQVQATVIDTSTGSQVWQGTSNSQSLDSVTCVGSSLNGSPDTLWTNSCFYTSDTGGYAVQYEAVLNDTADCDPSSNMGNAEEFYVTERTYAIDEFNQLGGTSTPVSSPNNGANGTFGVYNMFEFTWMDNSRDTVKQVCFYLDDTTQAGAGPIVAGLSSLAGPVTGPGDAPVYGQSEPYYADAQDIGGWVCLDITRDTNGNAINGVPVPVTGSGGNEVDHATTAFVQADGSAGPVGIATAGLRQTGHSFQYGDFFGNGENLYTPNSVPMVRLKMNRKDANCSPDPVQSLRDQLDERGFFLGQNRPNPFSDKTTIAYELDEAHNVKFTVRDVTGKVVKRENYGSTSQGRHRIELNSSNFDAGIYYYTLQVDGERATKKMVINR